MIDNELNRRNCIKAKLKTQRKYKAPNDKGWYKLSVVAEWWQRCWYLNDFCLFKWTSKELVKNQLDNFCMNWTYPIHIKKVNY